jgi:hypothetical protein
MCQCSVPVIHLAIRPTGGENKLPTGDLRSFFGYFLAKEADANTTQFRLYHV